MKVNINKLQKILNVRFKKLDLLTQAITHKSYNSNTNYEILEFLGDRILGLTISHKLIELYPYEKVGILDKRFSNLVNKKYLLSNWNKIKIKSIRIDR